MASFVVADENHEEAAAFAHKEKSRCDNAYTRANKTKLDSDPLDSHRHHHWSLAGPFRIANYSRVQKVVSRVFLGIQRSAGVSDGRVVLFWIKCLLTARAKPNLLAFVEEPKIDSTFCCFLPFLAFSRNRKQPKGSKISSISRHLVAGQFGAKRREPFH